MSLSPTKTAAAAAAATVAGLLVLSYSRLRRFFRLICAFDDDLPIGLPNPRNVCYLNALLQAMSTNASLVRFLKKRARISKSRLLYALVCLLKGLRCSNRYIATHNLEGTLRIAHAILLEELLKARNWSEHDQQDAHELYNFLMDVACHQPVGFTALKANEGLTSFSQFIGPRYEQLTPRCFHRALVPSSTNSCIIRSPLRTEVFQQHLLVSQVTCQNCDYRGSPVLQPEACLTLFFDSSSTTRPSAPHPASEKNVGKSVPKLTECLSRQFGVREPLPDLRCPRCQSKEPPHSGNCSQERWIAHLPPCLVLHVQRSAWLGNSGGTQWNMFGIGSKRSDFVQFPYRLNMAKYMLFWRCSTSPSSLDHHRNSSGDFTFRNVLSQLQVRQSRTYVLRSVLVHQGELITSGHYVAYRSWRRPDLSRQNRESFLLRTTRRVTSLVTNFFRGVVPRPVQPNSPWVLTSDNHVLRVPDQEVRSSLAYLLFYERDASTARADVPSCMTTMRSRSKLNGSFHSIASEEHETDWDAGEERSVNLGDGDTDDDGDLYDAEEDDEESDEASDVAEEFMGVSKADVIRTCALAASCSL